MRILVLGGTGAMGGYLCKYLSVADNQVFVTTRSKKESERNNINYIIGNAHNDDFLSQLLKDEWDCIVDFMVYNTKEFELRAEKLLSATKQYVFLSSARVYADSRNLITEKSPRLLDSCVDEEYLATDEYALTKARQENILFENSKKNWTIIRPYITYSDQRLQLGVLEKEEWLYLALYGNALIFSKDIASHITTLTYGSDVAKGIAAIIGKSNALGETFHITGNYCDISWNDIFLLYKETLKDHGIFPQVYLTENCYRIDTSPAKYQVLYDRLYNRKFDNSKISKFLDVDSFVKPKEGLKKCLENFLINPKFNNIIMGAGISNAIHCYDLKIPLNRIPNKKQKLKYILLRLHLLNK